MHFAVNNDPFISVIDYHNEAYLISLTTNSLIFSDTEECKVWLIKISQVLRANFTKFLKVSNKPNNLCCETVVILGN